MRARKPVIGVPADRRLLGSHWFHCVGEKYLAAIVEGADAVPVVVPAFGDRLELATLLQEVYTTRPGLAHGGIPNDPELPLPLDKVHPLHEVVKIDHFIPGCPPSADVIWTFLTDLLAGRKPSLDRRTIHFD